MPTYKVKNSFVHNGAVQLVGKTVELNENDTRTRVLLRSGNIALVPPTVETPLVEGSTPRGTKAKAE